MTILNEYTTHSFGVLSGVFLAWTVFFSISFVWCSVGDSCRPYLFLLAFAVLCFIAIFVCAKDVSTYEVLLDDQYTAKEFFDSYIFIEKKGEIYVIKEIEKEEEE